MNLFKKILVPTDNSKNSKEAFKYAVDLAKKHDSMIYVLHVIDISYIEEAGRFETSYFKLPNGYGENLLQEGKAETDEFIKEGLGENQELRIERYIRKGNPYTEIVNFAKEIGSDLIIMGTHGRTGLSHVLMGSITEKIVRKAHCPVLTVKPRKLKIEAA
jgi:universal stress protein A